MNRDTVTLKMLQERRDQAWDAGDRAAYDAFDLLIVYAIDGSPSTLAVYHDCNYTLGAVRSALRDAYKVEAA